MRRNSGVGVAVADAGATIYTLADLGVRYGRPETLDSNPGEIQYSRLCGLLKPHDIQTDALFRELAAVPVRFNAHTSG